MTSIIDIKTRKAMPPADEICMKEYDEAHPLSKFSLTIRLAVIAGAESGIAWHTMRSAILLILKFVDFHIAKEELRV